MKQMAGINKMQKLEYALNAIVYCMWYNKFRFYEFMFPFAEKIGTILAMCIHSAEHMEKEHPEYVKREHQKMNDFWYDKEKGVNISLVENNFNALCSFYTLFLYVIFLPPIFKLSLIILPDLPEDKFIIFGLIILGLLLFSVYIIVYKAVFRRKKYLEYFQIFEKKDMHWLRKWKWITLTFYLGGFAALPLGIGIAILLSNILR